MQVREVGEDRATGLLQPVELVAASQGQPAAAGRRRPIDRQAVDDQELIVLPV